MKVLMFGWEFPPWNSGGLGTACYGLCKGLSNQNIDVAFVIPRMPDDAKTNVAKLISADLSKVKIKSVNSPLIGYMTYEEYEEVMKNGKKMPIYGKNLFYEVERYAKAAKIIALEEEHDVIHAHDWLTYKAGIEAKKVSGKPLVIHVHATEFDRTGGNRVNQYVYDIEKLGMNEADRIMTVSQFTKDMVINNYGIDPSKIDVVHNAVEFTDNDFSNEEFKIKEQDKVVLFLGRITLQKGPDYFVYAAKKCLEFDPNIKFVVAGSGDMEPFMIDKAAELGIGDKMLFTGFLRGKDIDRAYQMADVYVMPSVSEPFGITPLEAMRNNTPVIISKQSGVSEVINHCLKVDFWDIETMANQILGLLHYKEARDELEKHGSLEVKKFDWNIPARKCIDVYNKVIGGRAS